MKIDVTHEHINAGKRKCLTKCPVALAIKEQLGVRGVKVGDRIINIGPPHRISVRTPDVVENFISAFDDNWSHGVQPFYFNLPIDGRHTETEEAT